jgi:hypothetical protein
MPCVVQCEVAVCVAVWALLMASVNSPHVAVCVAV